MKIGLDLDDVIYGREEIMEDVLIDLINSVLVQRLKKISQYGIPDEYYHKKNYSRYEHSLGVMILLRRLGADIEEQIAGLLHDVSHTCFSHVVDWVVGDPTKEDYQDNNHSNIIENSEIPSILRKHDFDCKKILEIGRFRLLEKEIPSLCADRIDYSLREMIMDGKKEVVEELVKSLVNMDGQIVFNSKICGEKFAREYGEMQNEHWAGKEARTRYYILSNILKKALKNNIIELDDFNKTDFEVIEKLKNSLNVEILNDLNLLKNGLIIEEVSYGGFVIKKKFRYVDPEVLNEGRILRLSEIFEDYKNVLNEEKRNSKIEKRYIYRGVKND